MSCVHSHGVRGLSVRCLDPKPQPARTRRQTMFVSVFWSGILPTGFFVTALALFINYWYVLEVYARA